LDLIEEERCPGSIADAGSLAELLLDHSAQVDGGHTIEPLILQAEIKQRFTWRTGGQAVGKALPQEGLTSGNSGR